MEPEVDATRPIPTSGELLADLRAPTGSGRAAVIDQAEPVQRDLPDWLDEDFPDEIQWLAPDDLVSPDSDELLDPVGQAILEEEVEAASPLLDQLAPRQRAYFRKAIWNRQVDEWRQNQRYYKRHESLEAREEINRRAEARDERLPYADARARPSDDPSVELELAETAEEENRKLYDLLKDLPLKLAVMAYVLPRVKGNVSELARQLGQPQRHTAREVERIRAHLKAKLGA